MDEKKWKLYILYFKLHDMKGVQVIDIAPLLSSVSWLLKILVVLTIKFLISSQYCFLMKSDRDSEMPGEIQCKRNTSVVFLRLVVFSFQLFGYSSSMGTTDNDGGSLLLYTYVHICVG